MDATEVKLVCVRLCVCSVTLCRTHSFPLGQHVAIVKNKGAGSQDMIQHCWNWGEWTVRGGDDGGGGGGERASFWDHIYFDSCHVSTLSQLGRRKNLGVKLSRCTKKKDEKEHSRCSDCFLIDVQDKYSEW